MSSEAKNSTIVPQKSMLYKKRACNICGERVGEKIKRHTLAKHLPWFLNPIQACWDCELYVRDLDAHKQACSPFCHSKPHFSDSVFAYWCELVHGLLVFLKNQFDLSNFSDLHKFVLYNGLFPPPVVQVTGNFDSWHVKLLSELSMLLGMPSHETVFAISPPNHVLCILHWKILSKLVVHLNEDARDALKSTSFPMPFPCQLQLGCDGSFIDSHCHMDKIFRDSGFRTFVDYLEYSQYKVPNLQFCVSNFVYPNLLKTCKPLQDASDMIQGTIGVHPHFVEPCRVQDQVKEVAHQLTQGNFVGVGEIGVDYTSTCNCNFVCNKDESCEKVQAQLAFIRNLLPFASQHKIALVVHCRGLDNADGRAAEAVRLLIQKTGYSDLQIHRHCFIGNLAEVNKWLSSFPNVMFGFTKQSLKDFDTCTALLHLPINKVLLETDSPYLGSPDPWSVKKIAETVSKIKNVPLDVIRKACNENARTMYKL